MGEERREDEPVGLWPIRRALTVAIGTAIVALTVLTVATLAWVTYAGGPSTLTATELLDVLKLVLATVAGAGALFALVMAYRKQRLAEFGEARERTRTADDQTRVFNERFATAVGMLGHEVPAVRLAGVYAIAGLADDWEHGRQTCVDVLCAYLRMPYDPGPGPDATVAERLAFGRDQQVRHTAIRVIGAHLGSGALISWHGHSFDLHGVVFDGGDFSGAEFSEGLVSFSDAVFSTGRVDFSGAVFSGAAAHFDRARFSGSEVDFSGATFSAGQVGFRRAAFTGGSVAFTNAEFSGATVTFEDATFAGSEACFRDATFSAGRVSFLDATFSAGLVDFRGADFAGGDVTFGNDGFIGGRVDLSSPGRWTTPPRLTGVKIAAPPPGLHLVHPPPPTTPRKL